MGKLPSERGTEHKRHEVKIAASYYDDVASGKKRFELRKNDRGIKRATALRCWNLKTGNTQAGR